MIERKRTSKITKQRLSTPAVYRLRHSETKNIVSRNVVSGIKHCLIRGTCFIGTCATQRPMSMFLIIDKGVAD